MLIIVESPAKAKTISQILGKNYKVKASIGHIRQISDDKKTKDGRNLEINGIDIDNNFLAIYEIDSKKNKVIQELKKKLKEEKEVLFATDEDREGEAISWHLAEVLKIPVENVRRLVFHEITANAINNSFKNIRNLDINLVKAQQTRQILDKLVGYKLSPVLWKVMYNNRLSAGRVQTPALKLIYDRELEIKNFVPKKEYQIYGNFSNSLNNSIAIININDDNKNLFKEDLEKNTVLLAKSYHNQKIEKNIESTKILSILKDFQLNPKFTVINTNINEENYKSQPPFITSTLQQTASSKLGFSPKQTMSLAQKLYEGITIDGKKQALITYMRTDSTFLSEDFLKNCRNWIQKNYSNYLPKNVKKHTNKSKNAQEAHEAIRPVDAYLEPKNLINKLEPNLYKLYNLIWKRTIASQMTDEIKQRYNFELKNTSDDIFSGSCSYTINLGYKVLYPELINPEDKQKYDFIANFFDLNKIVFLDKLFSIEHFTEPPKRYSPASLIKHLEKLGIGRPSTYASIISTLQDRGYVDVSRSSIIPTFLGMNIAKLLSDNFSDVTSSELTSKMEEGLDKIAQGELDNLELLKNFWSNFKQKVDTVSSSIQSQKNNYNSQETEVLDPVYGNPMILKIGRFGEYYKNPEHKESIYPKNFQEIANIKERVINKFSDQLKNQKCEKCQKDMIFKVTNKTLLPYIACPDYRLNNGHSIKNIDYGACPKCQEAINSTNATKEDKKQRNGRLTLRSLKNKKFLACNLDKKVCGYTQKFTEF